MSRFLSSRSTFITAVVLWLMVLASLAFAQPNVSATTSFIGADGTRTYMDIGGAWDGTQDVSPGPTNPNPPATPSGDTFSFELRNTGSAPAADLGVTVALPAGFNYVDGTANVTVVSGTCTAPTLTPSQTGTALTLLPAAGYSLPNGCVLEFTYDLVTTTAVVGGTYQVTPTWTFTGGSGNRQQNILVRPGDFLLTKEAQQDSASFGDIVNFDVEIVNSGSGGLFDADIRDILGNGLTNITFTPPGTPPGSTPTLAAGEDDGYIFEYLDPGQTINIPVSAQVNACLDLVNTVNVDDRTGITETSFDSVIFELDNPQLDFNPANFALDNTNLTNVSIPVQNTGPGPAYDLEIDSNLNNISGLTITGTGDWDYDPGNGTFTYTGGTPAGFLDAGDSTNITFEAQVTGCPPTQTGSNIIWEPAYNNICGAGTTPQEFEPPLRLSSFSVNNVPSINVDKSASADRINIGQAGSYTINVSGTNVTNLSDDPLGADFTLTDVIPSAGLENIRISTLPAGLTVEVDGNPYTAGDIIPPGASLTVEGENADLAFSLQIDFEGSTSGCAIAGERLPNTASLQHNVCSLNSSSDANFILNESPEGATVTQDFTIFNSVNAPFETGLADGDGTPNNEAGEGEAITYQATYELAGTGTWAGSTFTADLVVNETYIDGSIVVEVDGNPITVPPANITNTDPLVVDLSFIATDLSDANVDGYELEVRYSTTVTDAALGGSTSNNFLETVTLSVASGAAGLCGDTAFVQSVEVPIVRANPTISLSGVPNVIDICQPFTVTATINQPQGTGDPPPDGTRADNFFIDFDTSNYQFVGNPATDVTIGGHLASDGGATTAAGGSGVTVDFTDNFFYENGDGNSTVEFDLQFVPSTAAFPSGLGAELSYDDWQTQSALSATPQFTSNATASASIVRQAEVIINVSPQTIPVRTRNLRWDITVTNVGNGTAYNVTTFDNMPAGLTPDAPNSSPNPNGGGNPVIGVTGAGTDANTLTWDIGTLDPGESVTLTAAATVDGTDCNLFGAGSHPIVASWGCGGITDDSVTDNGPTFDEPNADIEIVHDTTNTRCTLCADGEIVIEVRNTGGVNLYDIILTEDLGTSGLIYQAGSSEVSLDGVNYTAVGDPALSGANNRILTWTPAEIAQLAELDTIRNNNAAPQEIFIRFGVDSPGETIDRTASFVANADYEVPCGARADEDSPGIPLTDVLDQPDIIVRKTGRNETANETAFRETVFGGAGDEVIWEIEIENRGGVVAEDVFLRDFIPAGANFEIIEIDDDVNFGSPQTPDVEAVDGRDETYYIADIPANSTRRYYVRGNVLAICNTTENTAEVEWGCPNPPLPALQINGLPGGFTSPSDNDDTATLVTEPVFVDGGNVTITQNLTSPAGGPVDTNGVVEIIVENRGGTARNIDLTNTIPTGYVYDPTFTPTITSSGTYAGQINQVTVDATNPAIPVFDLTSSTAADSILRFDETFTLTFRIVQNANFDTTQDATVREETEGNSLDPTPIIDSNNTVRLDFTNTCGDAGNFTDTEAVTPVTPDLDIDIDGSLSRTVTGTGDTDTFTVRINNRGDGQARNSTVTFTIGDGWQDVTVADLTTAGCTSATVTPGTNPGDPTIATCELPNVGASANITLPLTLTVANEDQPLTFSAVVEGDINQDDGTDTTNNYSLDSIATIVTGFDLEKTLVSCTEADSTNPTVFVGEDCTYRISARWFGGGTLPYTNVQVTDALPEGLGYISHTVDPNTTNTLTVDSFTPPAVGTDNTTLTWTLADFTTDTTTLQTFEVDVVARVLNSPQNSDADPVDNGNDLTNLANSTFTFNGETFDDSTTGFPPVADRQETVTVSTPDVTINKQVRNVTNGEAFGDDSDGDGLGDDNAEGEAGDVFEYQIVISNAAGRAPAYDLELIDTLPPNTKLAIQAFGGDTIDNDGDGNTDSGNEGDVTGQVITFDSTTADNALFDELPAGNTITLLYRVTALVGVNPSEVLTNDADLTYDTLPGDSGSQTAPQGTSGDPTGAREYTLSDSADVRVEVITTEAKEIIRQTVNVDGFDFTTPPTTIDGNTVPIANVVVGEQIQYRLTVQVPFGTINNFEVTDQLPAGMSLISFDGTSDPDSVCANNPPTTTPATPNPTTGGVSITWDFGTCVVNPGDSNVLTATYTAQVLNVASNVDDADLTNDAAYSSDSDTDDFIPITVNVVEPDLAITKTMNPDTNVDAGDTVTVTLEVANNGNAPAYNAVVTDLLNDNQAVNAGGIVGNVDGDDATVFDCTSPVTDTTATLPAGAAFAFDNGDGDDDSTDEANDCLVRYAGFDLAAGATATFTFEVTISGEIIITGDGNTNRRSYDNTANITATSLPTGAPGEGDDDFERDGSDGQGDDGFDGAFNATDTERLVSARVPNPAKIFTDSTDAFTELNNNNGEVTIGEVITVELTFDIPEGTLNDVLIEDRIRLRDGGSNAGLADITFLSAELARNNNTLTSSNDPGGVNGVVGTFVDVTGDIAESNGGGGANQFRRLRLELGDVVNSDTNNGADETYTLRLTYRFENNIEHQAGRELRNQPQFSSLDADGSRRGRGGPNRDLDILEPDLTVTKDVRNVTQGDAFGGLTEPQPEEVLEYRLTITNSDTDASVAYDIGIIDTLPEGFTYVDGSTATVDGDGNDGTTAFPIVTFGNPSIAGTGAAANPQILTWGRERVSAQVIHLAPDETLILTYQVRVTPAADLSTPLENEAVIDYSSLLGDDPFERTGDDGEGGALDDYETSDSASTAVQNPVIGLSKRLTTLGNNLNGTYDAGFSFTVTNLGNVTLDNVQVTDNLAATFPAPATIVSVGSVNVLGDLSAENPNFNGQGDINLLAGTEPLAPGESANISFLVTFNPNQDVASYTNTATATADDPDGDPITDISQNGDNDDPDGDGDPTNNNDPTPLALSEAPSIGLAKVLNGTIDNGNGTFTLSLTFRVENTGDVNLNNVQVTDDLMTTFPTPAAYTVVTVTSPGLTEQGNAGLTPNTGFNGDGDQDLLAGTDGLAVGDASTIGVVILLTPNESSANYLNSATATAESGAGTPVEDVSQDGTDVDPEGDGPSDNSDPTPIVLARTPIVGIAKRVLTVTPDTPAAGTYQVTYEIKVENLGNVPLLDVNVQDDLNATFGTLTGTFAFDSATVTSGTLQINSGYNGTSDILLTDPPNSSLAVGATGLIELVVNVTPDATDFNATTGAAGPYDNQASVNAINPTRDLTTTDLSDDGQNTDFDGDNNPDEAGENDPTPVIFTRTGTSNMDLQKYQLPPCDDTNNDGDPDCATTPGSANDSTQLTYNIEPEQYVVYTIEGEVLDNTVTNVVITDEVPEGMVFVNSATYNTDADVALGRSDLQCSTDGVNFAIGTCATPANVTHVQVVYDQATAVPARTDYAVGEILTLQFVVQVP